MTSPAFGTIAYQQEQIEVSSLFAVRDKWHRAATLLHAIVVASGIIAIAASASLAAFNAYMSPIQISSLGFLSAIAVGVPGALNIGNKANNFRWANRRIAAALMRYNRDRDFNALIDAYEEAEATIGIVKVDAIASNKGG